MESCLQDKQAHLLLWILTLPNKFKSLTWVLSTLTGNKVHLTGYLSIWLVEKSSTISCHARFHHLLSPPKACKVQSLEYGDLLMATSKSSNGMDSCQEKEGLGSRWGSLPSSQFQRKDSSKAAMWKTVTLPDSYNNIKKSKMGTYYSPFAPWTNIQLKTKDRTHENRLYKGIKRKDFAKVQIITQRSMSRKIKPSQHSKTQLTNTKGFKIAYEKIYHIWRLEDSILLRSNSPQNDLQLCYLIE